METGKLYYNTEMERLSMPEYGRIVLGMVESLKEIEDIEKRTAQAAAIVKVMEILNPSVKTQENYEQKLWDQLYIMAGFNLEVNSPYPVPVKESYETKPVAIPMKGTRIKATHYGRNIERIIELLVKEDESEQKTAMIKALATYMRQQYLIWNKDSVADETIFKDIEKLSDYKLKIPDGIELARISSNTNFSKPGMGMNAGQSQPKRNNRNRKGGRRK